MPICERDPWRDQYFENIPCPEDVLIPTDDTDAWSWYPAYNWIYDKLKIAASQGFACGPHGTTPPSYPIFSKPIVNLKGMGTGSCTIRSAQEMESRYTPGHFWLPLLKGTHISSDCALENGEIKWTRHATGISIGDGMFAHWILEAEPNPPLETYLTHWVHANMAGYTGMMNFETIGGKIIEVHLRFADQWCDLNGPGWIEAVIRLYAKGVWQLQNEHRHTGYSLPLFAHPQHGFRHPPPKQQALIRAMPHVSSLQITFHESKKLDEHPMPPGGFRLGLVNAWNLEAGRAAVDQLAKCFPDANLIRP